MILSNLFDALFDRGMTLVAHRIPDQTIFIGGGYNDNGFWRHLSYQKAHSRRGALRPTRLSAPSSRTGGRVSGTHWGYSRSKTVGMFRGHPPDEGERNLHIEILGRKIEARRAADGVVWFDFPQICDGPRSQNDYIELSRCYQTVVISNVPKLTKELEDQTRRFVALVDEFYDRRVKLILSAATALSSLYTGERLKLEFQRTRSRLEEMQSHDYLASPHIP
ncbi:MAG: hypothetical protein CM1200mP36_06350 [Gammaproteobacteria bacterium]|nr:MAG: hypothetical protein CM1200mP36_06350 [Gammaproteobacteria bacterium]